MPQAKNSSKKTKRSPPRSKVSSATGSTPSSLGGAQDTHSLSKQAGKWFGLPLLFYFTSFWLYAGTWMGHFNTRFFTDQGDGFQNVWNMWWVNFSVTKLHQLPWHTTFLHYPYGTTLVGQTLNPFNGFVGIFLQHILRLNLVQSFNIMVIFSFVFGGITAFWLCYYFSRSYVPSLIGGFLYTFSSYHFAHAIGHMQLVSLEWIPLFILLWWKLLTRPRYWLAAAAAAVLLLVLFCDYYYFIYCVISGGLIFIYLLWKREISPHKDPKTYLPLLLFIGLSLVFVAPLPLALISQNAKDPLIGGHNDRAFSTDLFSTIIDGGFWHFATLTHWYWRHVKTYIAESSVYFGASTIILLVIALWKRNKLNRYLVFWLVLGLIFAVFSLGPRLMVFGYSINHAPMPYALLEKLIPQLKLSGDPDRMIVMTTLAAAVIVSIVLSQLDLKKRKDQLLTLLFFIVLSFELWPNILPVNLAYAYPKYVTALTRLPAGAVIDNGAVSGSWQLYDQTIYQKPEVLGYISRTPTSVDAQDQKLISLISPGHYEQLCSVYKIRYLTTPAFRPVPTSLPIIYNDHQTLIYDLKNSTNC